jgi:nicotinate-nucleotide adenylyltransferase
MKKIGLLGGSFDPIHFGHLNLAFELMERGQLEEVWFIPAHVNPLKTHIPPVSFEHRLAMLKLAVEGISPFKIKDLESRRPAPSYTVETLRLLLAEFTARVESPHFYLLLGEDSIASFVHWHLPHEIVKMAHLLIGSCLMGSDPKGNDQNAFNGHFKYRFAPSFKSRVILRPSGSG